MNDYKLYLKTQKPIPFYNVCKIFQPSIDEILDMEDDKFNKLLLPYCITVDSLEGDIPEEVKKEIASYDLVIRYKDIVPLLLKSLKYFTKSHLSFDEGGIFFEGFEGRLNRDNFDEFAKIILEICARERPKKEVMPTFKNERQRDIWTKIQEGRKRSAKRNELKLEDVMNFAQYGGDYYISRNEILSFTLWELINAYKSKIGMSNYKDSFDIYLISGEKSLIEGKHWTDLIKLDYKSIE
jgi:hypothetical protein